MIKNHVNNPNVSIKRKEISSNLMGLVKIAKTMKLQMNRNKDVNKSSARLEKN